MAYIVRSFTPCFTLWFDVGICSLRDTSHNVYPTDVYPFSWVQLMSPSSVDLHHQPHAFPPASRNLEKRSSSSASSLWCAANTTLNPGYYESRRNSQG